MIPCPFLWPASGLTPEELLLQNSVFTAIIDEIVPDHSVFLACVDGGQGLPEYDADLLAGIDSVIVQKKPVLAVDRPILYLPVTSNELLIGVAVIEAANTDAFAWRTEDSLMALSRQISRELALFVRGAKDPLTGLLNGDFLQREMALFLGQTPAGQSYVDSDCVLVLIEVWPRVKNSEAAAKDIQKSSGVLQGIFGDGVRICHLGNGVYGMLWDGADSEATLKMCEVIINRLRNDGFPRVHIGIRPLHKDEEIDAQIIYADAWQCLREARGRGAAAHCLYRSPAELATLPLRPLPPTVMADLIKLWRRDKAFAVIIFKYDDGRSGDVFSARSATLVGAKNKIFELGNGEVCVYLPAMTEEEALLWAKDLQEKLQTIETTTLSAGLAVYPSFKFSKRQIALNARKALLHDSFFEPGSITAFDAVSQNISGDFYYNEGDLRGAIGEYKKGVGMDGQNVNLMNSLGVAHLQADNPKAARAVFEKALAVASDDFMALYNLGLLCLTAGGDNKKACAYFAKALALDKQNREVILQLAKLYNGLGRYKEIVKIFIDGDIIDAAGEFIDDDSGAIENGGGRICRYLGEAYKGLGQNRPAMTWLQRASRVNPHDPDVLSMLGELYCEDSQGDEIALSLCQQAVDIGGEDWRHWHRLAKVQVGRGEIDGAIDSLEQAVKLTVTEVEPAWILARLYRQIDRIKDARRIYRSILKINPQHKKAAVELEKTGKEQR